jgi:hypothetical protein
LWLDEPPTLRFVFETSERIEINLLEEKAAMGFLKREEKPQEKVKATKASLPSHAADTSMTCFKCGKPGYLRKECKEGKSDSPQSGGYCSGCGAKGHSEAKCWKLHPDLKPAGSKGANVDGDKKSWKARFAELEAKMVAMSATTNSGGPKPHDTPSFHACGGSLPDDEEFEYFILSGMAITVADLTLEAFAHIRNQTAAPKEAPRGASPSLDPQRGEGNKQARLQESFTLGEVVPTSSMVPPIRVRGPSAKIAQGGAESVEAPGVVNEAAAKVYQTPLISAAMVSRVDFSPTVVFKMVATMCERGSSTATNAMKTEVHLKAVVDSEEDTVQELFAAAACVKTMPARPAIERSSISPGVVVVDNSQGIFQLVEPKGKVFVPRRVLLDSGAQPLMLGASAIAGLELTKDTLEECPWTISTSMGGTERATGITKAELSLKLNQEDVEDAGFMKVKNIVTEAKSYDVLVWMTVLYPMGFTLDFWEEIASYRLGWQAGDGRKAQLPARFVRVLTGNLADLYAFSSYVDADLSSFKEDFDSNAFATHVQGKDPVTARGSESIKVYQPGVEAAWSTTSQLREATKLVIQEAWQELLLPRMEEEVNGEVDLGLPLDSSTIHWRPPEDGIVLLELFGGIGNGLVAVLQVGLKVKRYIYVDVDEAAR